MIEIDFVAAMHPGEEDQPRSKCSDAENQDSIEIITSGEKLGYFLADLLRRYWFAAPGSEERLEGHSGIDRHGKEEGQQDDGREPQFLTQVEADIIGQDGGIHTLPPPFR